MTARTPLTILHTEASLGWGGQEIRILTEAAAFQRAGHRVHLACDPDSDIFEAAPRFAIQAYPVPMKARSLGGLRGLRALFRELRPDVVNTHSSIDHWLCAAGRIGFPDAPAIVRTRHIDVPVSRRFSSRWLYNKGCEAVMATSQRMVADLTRDGFIDPNHISAVPTGIDMEMFSPRDMAGARKQYGLPDTAYLIGIVATLRQAKGHIHILEALAEPGLEDVAAVIVGDGPQDQNLRSAIARAGLDRRVTMAGRQTDVAGYLSALDAFVLPTYAEGVPQALLQAMACRRPVIASHVGGIPEVVDGLEAVLPIEPRSTPDLVRAIRQMRASPPSEAARDALRQRVSERYSIDRMRDSVEAVFRGAIRR